MSDLRRQKLANLLVNYSTAVQPGDWVGILGDFNALPILRDIYAAVLEAGGHPTLLIEDEWMQRYFLRRAADEQIAWIDPTLKLYTEEADVYIRARAPENTRAMTSINAERMQNWRAAQSAILQTRLGTLRTRRFPLGRHAVPNTSGRARSEYELRRIRRLRLWRLFLRSG